MDRFNINEYFRGKTNDDLIAYFLEDLHCRMEITQYSYPHEPVDSETEELDAHIAKCQGILLDYFRELINETIYEEGLILKGDEINYIYDKKKEEVFPLLDVHIYKYYEDVKINYVQL